MSRLSQKIEEITHGAGQSIGFRMQVAATKGAAMMLVAAVDRGDAGAAGVAREGADAVLLRGTGDVSDAVLSTLDSSLWGVSVDGSTGVDIAALKDKGCDYLVLDAESAPMALLGVEGVGKVVQTTASLEMGLVGAVGQLPVDAVLLQSGDGDSLSIQVLLKSYYVAAMTRRPLLVQIPLSALGEGLQVLHDAGVAGVVADVQGGDGQALSALKKAIESLPPRSRKKERDVAVLPFLGGGDMASLDDEE